MLKKIHNYLKNLSTPHFIFVIVALSFLSTIALLLCSDLLNSTLPNINSPKDISSLSSLEKNNGMLIQIFLIIISASVLAPLFETFIYQFAIIKLLQKIKFFKTKSLLLIIISALLFTLDHRYSLFYMLNVFPIGLLLAYSFIVYDKKNNHPFWIVFSIHSLRNFICLLLVILTSM